VEQFYAGKQQDRTRGDSGAGLRLRPAETSGDVVAIWTSGAAGDQNPVSLAAGSDFTLVEAFGKMLGEEAVRVAARIRTAPAARIRGMQQVVTCPGRRVAPGPRTPGES
jgi:hypothetical protein